MLPVPGPAPWKVLLLWGDSRQSEQLPQPYSRKASRKGRRAFRPALCVPGKVLAQMLLDVQEEQGYGESWLGSPLASGARLV